MQSVLQFISQHQLAAGAAGLWVFSAMCYGMPDPDATSGKGYIWLYRSLHLLAANLDKTKAVPKP